jgi:hypothetical protein
LTNSINQNYKFGNNIATVLAAPKPILTKSWKPTMAKARSLILKQRKPKISNTKLKSKLTSISIKNGNKSLKQVLSLEQDAPKA